MINYSFSQNMYQLCFFQQKTILYLSIYYKIAFCQNSIRTDQTYTKFDEDVLYNLVLIQEYPKIETLRTECNFSFRGAEKLENPANIQGKKMKIRLEVTGSDIIGKENQRFYLDQFIPLRSIVTGGGATRPYCYSIPT